MYARRIFIALLSERVTAVPNRDLGDHGGTTCARISRRCEICVGWSWIFSEQCVVGGMPMQLIRKTHSFSAYLEQTRTRSI